MNETAWRLCSGAYRALLIVLPSAFRRTYRAELVLFFEDGCRDAHRRRGWPGLFFHAFAECFDLIRCGLAESTVTLGQLRNASAGRRGIGEAMDHSWSDLRLAVRNLRRQPAFVLTAVLTFGVAIGANSMVFSLVKGVLLAPLDFPEPERLLVLHETHPEGMLESVSAPNYRDWTEQSRLLESLGGFRYWGYTFTGGDEPVDVPSLLVTPSTFRVLAVPAALGRVFAEEEGAKGRERVVVLSHGFWDRRLGRDPAVLGKNLELDARPHTVVGVMPPGFVFPPDQDVELWTPLAFDPEDVHSRRRVRNLNVVARARAGATLTGIQEEMDVIAGRLAQAHPESNKDWGVRVVSAHEQLVEDVRPALLALFAAVGFLLLIACANLAHLLLARLAGRERDLAVRVAMGAGRWPVTRQFLAETLVLVALGGAVGLLFARWGTGLLRAFPQDVLPRLKQVEIDITVILFTLTLCSLVGLVLGQLQAQRASRFDLTERLREGGGAPSGARLNRTLGSLVVAEVALALVLLMGAGLMLRSFGRLGKVDPGFHPDHLLAANIFLPDARYPDDHRQLQFFEDVLARTRSLPGVLSAGAVTSLPLHHVGIDFDLPFEIEGQTPPPSGEKPQADFRLASTDYFQTMGIRLLRGRVFDGRDRDGSPRVMVVNETMARRHFPDGEPLGEHVSIPMGGKHEVVGIVSDVRHYGLSSEPRPEMYLPMAQGPFGGMVVVLRTAGEPLQYVAPLKREVLAVDPQQPLYDVRTMEDLLSGSVFMPRLNTTLSVFFAGTALLLAALGLYGVMATRWPSGRGK